MEEWIYWVAGVVIFIAALLVYWPRFAEFFDRGGEDQSQYR
jgi:hypothetical protein